MRVRFVVVVAIGALIAHTCGYRFAVANQLTYFVDPLHRAHPELFHTDWLVTSTDAYHRVFSMCAAWLYRLDDSCLTSAAVTHVVLMIAHVVALYAIVTAVTDRYRLTVFAIVIGWIALAGERSVAGSYLWASYLQPSTVGTRRLVVRTRILAARSLSRDRHRARDRWDFSPQLSRHRPRRVHRTRADLRSPAEAAAVVVGAAARRPRDRLAGPVRCDQLEGRRARAVGAHGVPRADSLRPARGAALDADVRAVVRARDRRRADGPGERAARAAPRDLVDRDRRCDLYRRFVDHLYPTAARAHALVSVAARAVRSDRSAARDRARGDRADPDGMVAQRCSPPGSRSRSPWARTR